MVASEAWTEVRTAIVAVLAAEGRRLKQLDESLIMGARGTRMRYGDVSCWLTVSRRGAVDPHMEIAVNVTGEPDAYRMRADIGTFEGEVLSEMEGEVGHARTVEEMTGRLRRFLDDNVRLLEGLATS